MTLHNLCSGVVSVVLGLLVMTVLQFACGLLYFSGGPMLLLAVGKLLALPVGLAVGGLTLIYLVRGTLRP